jgi:hypothetical protein
MVRDVENVGVGAVETARDTKCRNFARWRRGWRRWRASRRPVRRGRMLDLLIEQAK